MLLANPPNTDESFTFPASIVGELRRFECENSLVGWIRVLFSDDRHRCSVLMGLSILVPLPVVNAGLIRIYPEYRTALECNPTDVTCLTGCALKAGAVFYIS